MDPERTRVIHRDLNRTYPTLVRGEGVYLYDARETATSTVAAGRRR